MADNVKNTKNTNETKDEKMPVVNKRKVIGSSSFVVIFEAGDALKFHKVSNMSAQLDYETYNEGGQNNYPRIIINPSRTASKLILSRYVDPGDKLLTFIVGTTLILPIYVGVFPGTVKQKSNKDGYSMMFTGCTVVGHSFSDLDANKSGLLEETVEVVYQKMYYMPGLQISGIDEMVDDVKSGYNAAKDFVTGLF